MEVSSLLFVFNHTHIHQKLSAVMSTFFPSFILGYSRAIPGNPRYTTIGNEENGEYNLQITNVTLEDDGNYECQVGPASYNRPIRKAAHLHVLLPPKSIEIVGHQAGSRVDIRENEEVELTCKVANAKPKADIVWFRKDSQFVTGKFHLEKHWQFF